MVTACIIQARLGSTRLPAKVMLTLPTGRTVLQEVLYRCKQIPGVNVIVCAIPDTAENDILRPSVFKVNEPGWPIKSVQIIRGPEHDVLARYAKAAEAVNADVVMRITADCPLIDPEVCGKVLRAVTAGHVNYASNVMPRTFPQGLDCEAFTADLLRWANQDATDPGDREHVTPFMQRAKVLKTNVTEWRCDDRPHLRWTLDTKDDYVTIWNVMEQQMREAA